MGPTRLPTGRSCAGCRMECAWSVSDCAPLPHLHGAWARPWTSASAMGLGSTQPHLRRDLAHPWHICAGPGLAPATSAPRLGSPLATSAPGLGTGCAPTTVIVGRSSSNLRKPSTSGGRSNATCKMPNAMCYMPNATCKMPNATCNMPNATCNMPCNRQNAECNVQHALSTGEGVKRNAQVQRARRAPDAHPTRTRRAPDAHPTRTRAARSTQAHGQRCMSCCRACCQCGERERRRTHGRSHTPLLMSEAETTSVRGSLTIITKGGTCTGTG